jgi:hypothetical protein
MVHGVEAAFDVGLHHIPIPPVLPVKGEVADRFPCPALGALPITAGQQLLRIDGIQEPGPGGLEEFILEHRDA